VGRVSVLVEWDNVIGHAFYRSRAFTEIGKRRQEVVGSLWISSNVIERSREACMTLRREPAAGR